jgi:hypothetical protein
MGAMASFWARQGADVTRRPRAVSVEMTRRRFRCSRCRVEIEEADGRALPFADVVRIRLHWVSCTTRPISASPLREMMRVLRPGDGSG